MEVTKMDELWNAIKEMEPTLGDANKPLAIAASYALLKGNNEKLEKERDAALIAAGCAAKERGERDIFYWRDIARVWYKAHNAWLKTSRHGTKEQADEEAINILETLKK